MTPLAHAAGGHWLIDFAYLAPVIVIVVWISVKALLDRRRADAEVTPAREPAGPAPDPPE